MNKTSIRTFSFLIALCGLTATHAQSVFEGRAVYSVQAQEGEEPATAVFYYHGADYYTEMKESASLYVADEGKVYSSLQVNGKPITTVMDVAGEEVPLFEFGDVLELVQGHRCLRVQYELEQESHGVTIRKNATVWIDTSYHIPFYYGLDPDVPFGLEVQNVTVSEISGYGSITTRRTLQSVAAGEVDTSLFSALRHAVSKEAVQSQGGIIVQNADDNLQPVPPAAVSQGLVAAMDSAEFLQAVQNGTTLLMLTAPWCKPCRLLHPRLEAVAATTKDVRFVEVDIDRNPSLMSRYGVQAIPTLIFLSTALNCGARWVAPSPKKTLSASFPGADSSHLASHKRREGTVIGSLSSFILRQARYSCFLRCRSLLT